MARKATPAPLSTPMPRGRKPKAAAAPEPALAAASDAAEAAASTATPMTESAPVRGRPGRKPKPRGEAAMPSLTKGAAGQQPDAGVAAAKAAAAEDDVMIAEMAYPVSAGAGSDAVPPSSSLDAATPAKPAAQWDRATGTVRFDWAEIEHTASQEGANQVMAKLLVAARAEGANSRWPL